MYQNILKPKSRNGITKMKRIINNKMYNTETAKLLIGECYKGLGTWSNLYQKVNGEFFLAHYTEWEGASDCIEPINNEYAKEIISENDVDLYIKIFGEPEE